MTTGDPDSKPGLPFWIDLLNPTSAEAAQVSTEFGVRVPSRELLQEIETSSRIRADGDVLYVSMPLPLRDEAFGYLLIPLGFILSPDVLITIRYSDIHAFSSVREQVEAGGNMSSGDVFAGLIDGMVDFTADMLEKLSSDLASVSARAFGRDGVPPPSGKLFSSTLRGSLNAVGAAGDHLSRIRESLLGLQRILAFAPVAATSWLRPELKSRLQIAREDLASLVDFESHLSSTAQFLLDAILGFINTEQNDIFKVLTIASVIGIPPTLIASMYGMNFHNMPELSWRFGYPYGLALIAASIVVPILWFKRRGWW
jgi:magnesium transporter